MDSRNWWVLWHQLRLHSMVNRLNNRQKGARNRKKLDTSIHDRKKKETSFGNTYQSSTATKCHTSLNNSKDCHQRCRHWKVRNRDNIANQTIRHNNQQEKSQNTTIFEDKFHFHEESNMAKLVKPRLKRRVSWEGLNQKQGWVGEKSSCAERQRRELLVN